MVTNRQLSIQSMRDEVKEGSRTLDTFKQDVGQYLAQQQQIENLKPTADCGIVCINLQVDPCHSSSAVLQPLLSCYELCMAKQDLTACKFRIA